MSNDWHWNNIDGIQTIICSMFFFFFYQVKHMVVVGYRNLFIQYNVHVPQPGIVIGTLCSTLFGLIMVITILPPGATLQ